MNTALVRSLARLALVQLPHFSRRYHDEDMTLLSRKNGFCSDQDLLNVFELEAKAFDKGQGAPAASQAVPAIDLAANIDVVAEVEVGLATWHSVVGGTLGCTMEEAGQKSARKEGAADMDFLVELRREDDLRSELFVPEYMVRGWDIQGHENSPPFDACQARAALRRPDMMGRKRHWACVVGPMFPDSYCA